MATANFKAGDIVDDAEFNKLFEQLEEIRKVHKAASGLTSAQQTALSTAYNTTVANAGVTVRTSVPTELKNDITNLENSPYLSGFSSQITIPTVGALLSFSMSSGWQTVVTNMKNACANCSYFSSNFTSAANKGNFSSNFTSAANQSNFSANFTSAANKGNFSSNFSSNFSPNFTSAANKGNFTANFTSNKSSNFTNNFSSYFSTNASKGYFSSNQSNFTSNKCSGIFKIFNEKYNTNLKIKRIYNWVFN